jgi:23S rRNA (pseudouridine1915-N3)-methyltransferase
MMNIIILAAGSLKQRYFKEAAEEYQKRLKPLCKLEIVEFKAESFGAKDEARAKKLEAEKINNFLSKQKSALIIACDERGQSFTSEKLSAYLDKENRPIIFIIGGATGLDKTIIDKANLVLSLSGLTFPHELARVILLEQLYRAVTISKGIKYHY